MLTLGKNQKGAMLMYLIVIIFMFSILMVPILDVVAKKMTLLRSSADREQALQIAEAGISYYQWHLAHFPSDYKDGTNPPGASSTYGPFVHDYSDFDTQTKIGKFSLMITPNNGAGSSVVTIQSTGWTLKNPTVTRVVTVKYGKPSMAKYAFLSNDIIWIGNTESVSGQVLSNNGIRFDGVGNAPIQSAKSTYLCPANQGSPCPTTKNGVWGSANQATQSFWQFPMPAIDFSTITSDLAVIKAAAQPGNTYYPPSNAQGYSFVFNVNGTMSVYKVTSLRPHSIPGKDTNWIDHNEYLDYNARTLLATQAMPGTGVIYVEDRVWVEGTVKGRVTLVAAKLPYNAATAPSIYIPNNITYAAKDGTNVLGLISQKDIVATYYAPNNLEIDAAMIAQNGGTQFFYYPGNVKTSITIYGAIMTFAQWTWSWVDMGGVTTSGYLNTFSGYDSNLLYSPPPYFPLSSSDYQVINWVSN